MAAGRTISTVSRPGLLSFERFRRVEPGTGSAITRAVRRAVIVLLLVLGTGVSVARAQPGAAAVTERTRADVSAAIHAYPTLAQVNRRVADQRLKEGLTPTAKAWMRRLFGQRGA